MSQAAIPLDVPRGFLGQRLLHRRREFARHNFRVDGVGHSHWRPQRNEAKVADVLDVPGVLQTCNSAVSPFIPSEQGFDDPSHPRLAEFVRELIKMSLPVQNHFFLSGRGCRLR